MTRQVVQDSDDESDFEDKPCSPVRLVDNGTGSTESLRRKIEVAYDDLLAPPTQSPSPTTVDASTAHISPTVPDSTRKSTAPTNSTKPPATKINASISHQSHDPPIEHNSNSQFLYDISSVAVVHNAINPAGSDVILEPPTLSTLPPAEFQNGLWELPGLIQDDFDLHQPMAMFPDMSSTVPNNTLTQQKLIDEALHANRPDTHMQMPLPDPTRQDSSIPWSAYMKTPSVKRASAEWAPGTIGDSIDRDRSAILPSSHAPTIPEEQEGSTHINTVKVVSRDATLRPLEEHKSSKRARSKSVQDDDRSKTNPPTDKRRKARGLVSEQLKSDNFDDDVAAIGLPKERYQPRPSRSRSSNVVMQEPIDYSVRPERVNKARAKRRITTGSIGQLVLSSSEKAERICAMGFSPSNAKTALKVCDGEFDQAVEWLLDRPGSSKDEAITLTKEPGILSQVAPMDVKRNKKSSVRSPPKELARELLHVEIPARNSPTKLHPEKKSNQGGVHETIEAGVGQESGKPEPLTAHVERTESSEKTKVAEPKTKSRKTADVEENKDATTSNAPLSTVGEKKRSRGRPHRTEKPAESLAPPHEDALTEEGTCEGPVLQAQEGHENQEPRPRELGTTASTGANRSVNTSPEIAIDAAAASETATKEPKAPRPNKVIGGSVPPSGISKVPLRVGLSKRTKIAPLLRIIRK